MAQIELDGLTKIYPVDSLNITAVDSVSMRVGKGDFISIAGHSGSGKTTLLSIIGGITQPTSGRVYFDGADIYSLDRLKLAEYRCEKIGFMFQFASLLPILTVKENLLLPVIFRSRKREPRSDGLGVKAAEMLEMVGLGDKIDSYPAQLSGGQQRRVAIARAFMNDPDVILADEPTGDLDEDTEADMIRFFKRMNLEKGITFITVTHSAEFAGQATRRLKMQNGHIQEL